MNSLSGIRVWGTEAVRSFDPDLPLKELPSFNVHVESRGSFVRTVDDLKQDHFIIPFRRETETIDGNAVQWNGIRQYLFAGFTGIAGERSEVAKCLFGGTDGAEFHIGYDHFTAVVRIDTVRRSVHDHYGDRFAGCRAVHIDRIRKIRNHYRDGFEFIGKSKSEFVRHVSAAGESYGECRCSVSAVLRREPADH